MPDDDPPDVKELRLAVVCYGGVSLAIYMHGITRELQALVEASEEYVRRPSGPNPYRRDPAKTHAAYWEAIRAVHGATGLRLRVVVDVIAGTSAGGINGVVLAKALAQRTSQERLRDVWLEQGDIRTLLVAPYGRLPGRAGLLAWAGANALRGWPTAPLRGDFLLEQVHEALERMDGSARAPRAEAPRDAVELHVTLTDFYGFPQAIPSGDPNPVRDLRQRHHLRFDSFGRERNRALAFAARATSSFPGAFSPVRLADLRPLGGDGDLLAGFPDDAWTLYDAAGADPEHTSFVDGGVLDNAPFDRAVDAIQRRPAGVEVERKLLYLDPAPADLRVQGERPLPTTPQSAWGGLSTIPRHQPISTALFGIEAANERVQRVRALLDAAYGDLDDELRALEAEPDPSDAAHARAKQRMQLAYTGYERLKALTVVTRLANLACDVVHLPEESDAASFIRDVVHQWAAGLDLMQDEEARERFLRTFDLGYAERRLHFVRRTANRRYLLPDPAGGPPRPQDDPAVRAALNAVKQAVFARLERLQDVRAGAHASLDRVVADLFAQDELAPYLEGQRKAAVAAFLADHGGTLDRLRTGLAGYLDRELAGFGAESRDALTEALADAPAQLAQELLRAYDGYPLWDALLFAPEALADTPALDPIDVIRVSPADTGLLHPPKGDTLQDKLKGLATMHFGAFFARSRRENDYLWGRLDGVERLLWLVLGQIRGSEVESTAYAAGFSAVLAAERGAMKESDGLLAALEAQVQGLAPGPVASPGTAGWLARAGT